MTQYLRRAGMVMGSLVVLAALISLGEELFSALFARTIPGLDIAGFTLDLVFSALMLHRVIAAAFERRFLDALGPQGEWIEFAASLPVLAGFSGPLFFAWLTHHDLTASNGTQPALMFGLQSLVSLRLLRLLHFADAGALAGSPSARSHVRRASALACAGILCSIPVLAILLAGLGAALPAERIQAAAAASIFALSLAVLLSLVLLRVQYGSFFLRTVSEPLGWSLRRLRGEETDDGASADVRHAGEEALAIRDLLRGQARSHDGVPGSALRPQLLTAAAVSAELLDPPLPPTSAAEIQGLLSRASHYVPPKERLPW